MFLLVTKVRHPGEGHYRIYTSPRIIDDRPIHLAPRQRGEGGAQRVSVGRVRGARSICARLEWNRERAGRLRRANRDAPHPPIASQWAPPLYGAFLVKTHLSILFSFEGGAVDRRLLGQDNLRRACHGWRLSRHNLVCGGSTKDPNHDA